MKAAEALIGSGRARKKAWRGNPFLAKEVLTDKINSAMLADKLNGRKVDALRVAGHARRILSEIYGLPLAAIDVEIDSESGAVRIYATPTAGDPIDLYL